jgi:hypothetical protein
VKEARIKLLFKLRNLVAESGLSDMYRGRRLEKATVTYNGNEVAKLSKFHCKTILNQDINIEIMR